jgi:predicted dinucleotide-binding enzyme
VLATPWGATQDAIREAGELGGKAVIDCTNPLKPGLSGLEVGLTASGADLVAQWAKVFKAFSTTGFNNMADPVINGLRTVMFVCGDDEGVKPTVLQLAADVGFDEVRCREAGDRPAAGAVGDAVDSPGL